MTNYSTLQANAKALIAAKGQSVTIAYDNPSSTDGSNYDPATGSISGDAPQAIAAKAVRLPLAPSKLKPDSNILQSDETLLIAADIAIPPRGSIVTLANGDTLEIIHIEQINPAGTAVLYDAIARSYQQ